MRAMFQKACWWVKNELTRPSYIKEQVVCVIRQQKTNYSVDIHTAYRLWGYHLYECSCHCIEKLLDTGYDKHTRLLRRGTRFSTHHSFLYQKVARSSLKARLMNCTVYIKPSYINLLRNLHRTAIPDPVERWLTLEIPSTSNQLGTSAVRFLAPYW